MLEGGFWTCQAGCRKHGILSPLGIVDQKVCHGPVAVYKCSLMMPEMHLNKLLFMFKVNDFSELQKSSLTRSSRALCWGAAGSRHWCDAALEGEFKVWENKASATSLNIKNLTLRSCKQPYSNHITIMFFAAGQCFWHTCQTCISQRKYE